MRDHDNMPVIDWTEDHAPAKATAQILHQEPVVLQMPDSFDASLDPIDFDCNVEGNGIHYNCDGAKVLEKLSILNDLPTLRKVADACFTSSSQVDIDPVRKRIIVHD
jgi:hypothetical protein